MSAAAGYPAADFDSDTRLLGVNGSGQVKVFDIGKDVAVEATADFTLALTDKGRLRELNKATALIVTIPPNSAVAFPIGTVIGFCQTGAGQGTFAAGVGVTIRNRDSLLTIAAQWGFASLYKRATNEWVLGL